LLLPECTEAIVGLLPKKNDSADEDICGVRGEGVDLGREEEDEEEEEVTTMECKVVVVVDAGAGSVVMAPDWFTTNRGEGGLFAGTTTVPPVKGNTLALKKTISKKCEWEMTLRVRMRRTLQLLLLLLSHCSLRSRQTKSFEIAVVGRCRHWWW